MIFLNDFFQVLIVEKGTLAKQIVSCYVLVVRDKSF